MFFLFAVILIYGLGLLNLVLMTDDAVVVYGRTIYYSCISGDSDNTSTIRWDSFFFLIKFFEYEQKVKIDGHRKICESSARWTYAGHPNIIARHVRIAHIRTSLERTEGSQSQLAIADSDMTLPQVL